MYYLIQSKSNDKSLDKLNNDFKKSLDEVKATVIFGKAEVKKSNMISSTPPTGEQPKKPSFGSSILAFLGQKNMGPELPAAPLEKQSNGNRNLNVTDAVLLKDILSKNGVYAASPQYIVAEKKENGKMKRFITGIEGFDKLFKTGIPEGAAVLVEGGPGSGKTIFCLQVAYASCKRGLKALYMSFEEPEARLKEHMANFGFDAEEYEKKGLLRIKRFNALDISRSVEALLSEAKKELLIDIQPVLIPKDFKPDIVCIDSLSSIAAAFSGEESRFRIYMEQFFRYLEGHNITSFLIRETSVPNHIGAVYTEKGEAISFLSDGIVVLYNVIYANGRRGRAIEVLKMRGENIDRRIVEAEIMDKKGFSVYPSQQLELKGDYKLT